MNTVWAAGPLHGVVGAGGSVLLGRDPGYLVFPPLLIYDTVMGLACLAAWWLAPRSVGVRFDIGLCLAGMCRGAVPRSSRRAGSRHGDPWWSFALAAGDDQGSIGGCSRRVACSSS